MALAQTLNNWNNVGGGTQYIPPEIINSLMQQQAVVPPVMQQQPIMQQPVIQPQIPIQNNIPQNISNWNMLPYDTSAVAKAFEDSGKPANVSQKAWNNASDEAKSRMKDMAAMQEMMRPKHPLLMGLAKFAMGMGQGMTKQPYLTDFENNQAALQKQSMDMINQKAVNSTVPIIMMGPDGTPKVVGDMPRGGKVINPMSSRMLSPEAAQLAADRIASGKATLSQFSKYQIGQISQYLPEDFDINKAELAYKANQSAMTDIKVQDSKVNLANNIMTTFNEAYDPKTDTYNIPPAQHVELAMNYAKMQSPTGVIAQDLVNQLTQGTAREKMAKIAIYFGADPKEVGGSTQSVLKWFRDNTDAQAQMAVKARGAYQQGKVSDYIGMNNQQGSIDPRVQKALDAGYTMEQINAHLNKRK